MLKEVRGRLRVALISSGVTDVSDGTDKERGAQPAEARNFSSRPFELSRRRDRLRDPMRRRVYLDNNATAPLLDVAREAIDSVMRSMSSTGAFGNPSSPHAFGHEARLALEESRGQLAAWLAVDPGELIFVSGGTESVNLAIQGASRAWSSTGKAPGHIVTSAVEHPTVLESCRYLESTGWRLSVLPVDGLGLVDPGALRAALRPDTALVSI